MGGPNAAVSIVMWFCTLYAFILGGRAERSEEWCPSGKLTVLAFVPCYDQPREAAQRAIDEDSCDVLTYGAVQLAAEHINRDSSILADTTLELKPVTLSEAVRALEILGRSLESETSVHGAITDEEIFAPLIADQLSIPAVTYSLTKSLTLPLRNNLFHRTLPSDVFISAALVALLERFEWYKIALLYSVFEPYIQKQEVFAKQFTEFVTPKFGKSVSIAFSSSFENLNIIEKVLSTIRQKDIHIIVAFFEEEDASKILCKASEMGLTSDDYVWIFPAYYDPNWWQNSSSCTLEEMRDAVQSVISVGPVKYPPLVQLNSSISPLEFRDELLVKTRALFPSLPLSRLTSLLLHSQATSAYDAVWTIASLWDSLLRESQCQNIPAMERALGQISDTEYNHLSCGAEEILQCISAQQQSQGICGAEGEKSSQDYYGQVLISQTTGSGEVCPVGVVWPGSGGGSFVSLRDMDSHYCLRQLLLGQWLRNMTQYPNTSNCTHHFQWKASFMKKLQVLLEDDYEDFESLENVEKSSYVLGSELWESKFDGLLALVKEYIVDVWEIRKHKLYDSDSGSGLQLRTQSSPGERSGGRESPPSSGFSIRNSTIDTASLVMTVIVLCVGYAALIAALVFNLFWRNNKNLKLASPRLNVVILVALSLTLTDPLFTWLVLSANDYNIELPLGGNILCWLNEVFITVGFSLLFLTLLLKNYRIYRIFYNKKLKIKAQLTDTKLFVAILVLLIPDIVALSFGGFFSPNRLVIIFLPENDEPDSYNFINITLCNVNDIVLIYNFWHTLILFALMAYFAIYTVQLKNRYSEEGKITAIVTLFCFLFLISYLCVLIFILKDLRLYIIGYLYSLFTGFSLLLTTVGLMFLPKVWAIYKDHKQVVRDKHSSEDNELQLIYFHKLLDKIQQLKLELNEGEKKIASIKSYHEETVKSRNTSSECVIISKEASHECITSASREIEASKGSLQAAAAHGEERGTESKEEELERTGTEGDTSLKDTGIDLLSLPL